METRIFNPELREVVIEASMALARLDAGRLEELALSCQALNRELVLIDETKAARLVAQLPEMQGDMAVFGRVLDVTRANLEVLRRAGERRELGMEYKLQPGPWTLGERPDGDD